MAGIALEPLRVTERISGAMPAPVKFGWCEARALVCIVGIGF